MHVIWKRPDGYHDANPTDFKVVELGGHSRMWLHQTDTDWFPFQISGGWQESEATKRLNNMINLLPDTDAAWLQMLAKIYDHGMADEPEKFFDEIHNWIGDLRSHLKGDTWELDIMNRAVSEVQNRLQTIRGQFLQESVK